MERATQVLKLFRGRPIDHGLVDAMSRALADDANLQRLLKLRLDMATAKSNA